MHTRAAIAFTLIWPPALAAQDTPVFPPKPAAVIVPVTVTDPSGRFVHSLSADQFEITEGGRRREIVQLSAGRVPVSLGILLDVSGSTAVSQAARAESDARWADTRRALELLLTRLDAADEVFFAAFNERVAAASWTQDRRGLLREFDALPRGGGNALLDAVPSILPTFELGRHQRKVLLLITDGNDANRSAPSVGPSHLPSDIAPPGHEPLTLMAESRETVRQRRLTTAKSAVRRSDVTLYAIGIGTRMGAPVDKVLLEGLTAESGGYVEPLRDPAEMSAAMARIVDDLQSQYLLAFEAGPADGKHHGIRVRTKDRRLRARARAGYVALPASAR